MIEIKKLNNTQENKISEGRKFLVEFDISKLRKADYESSSLAL